MLPLVVPIIIIAVGIFFVYARVGLVATMPGLVLANVMLGLPYVITSVVAGLQSFDATQEMVARSLGMNRLRSFLVVTLPQIKASVLTGAIFAFISALDETVVALVHFRRSVPAADQANVHVVARRDRSDALPRSAR